MTSVRALLLVSTSILVATSTHAELFVSSFTQNSVRRYDENTGAFLGTFIAAGSGGLSAPHRGIFGVDGNLYVASGGNSTIFKFKPTTGANLGAFVTSGSGGLSAPIGIEFGPDGNLYAASLNTDSVKEYNGTTGAFVGDLVTAASGGLDSPNFMTFTVPEPGVGALLAIGALAWVGRRGKRRKSSVISGQ